MRLTQWVTGAKSVGHSSEIATRLKLIMNPKNFIQLHTTLSETSWIIKAHYFHWATIRVTILCRWRGHEFSNSFAKTGDWLALVTTSEYHSVLLWDNKYFTSPLIGRCSSDMHYHTLLWRWIFTSLVSRLSCGGKRPWYTLFAHVPSSLGNLHTTPLH